MSKLNTVTPEVEKAVIRNYYSVCGTFDGIENVPGMPQQIKDIKNYYPYIGFKNKEELDSLTAQVTDDDMSQTIGTPIYSKYTKMLGDYLKQFKMLKLPDSNKYLGDVINKVSEGTFEEKTMLISMINNTFIPEVLPQFYPEVIIKEDLKYEGIYFGKIYVKQAIPEIELNELLAYMLNIKFNPSETFKQVTQKLLANPLQMEMLDLTEIIGVYREAVIFSNKYNILLADIWSTIGADYYDHRKTIKDGVLIMYEEDGGEKVTIVLGHNSLTVKMWKEDFFTLYNSDSLRDITIREEEVKTQKETYQHPVLFINELDKSLWEHLGMSRYPTDPFNLTGE